MSSKTGIILATIFLLLSSVTVSGHEKQHHQAAQNKSSHMQEMYALKEKIPEELRIMERTPIEPSADSIQRGEELYQQSCLVCHGGKGDGKGPAASSMSTLPANFLDQKHSAIYGPGEKFWIVGHGSGSTGMPAFKQIGLLDRWHLVNYIFHLQHKGAGDK